LGLAGLLAYHLVVARRCREFRHQALHDDLTGLPNRRCLGQVLVRVIADAKRSGEGASVVLIDLDHFKELNDSLGHSEGDAVLREAAMRFKRTLRKGDFLARVGGDEFCLLLPRTRPEEATSLAARLRSTLSERPLPLVDATVHLDATVGLSYCPSDGEEAGALLRSADVAMYASKRHRNADPSRARP
jgi:diguanylate cyclase (GGDEF)-like protein